MKFPFSTALLLTTILPSIESSDLLRGRSLEDTTMPSKKGKGSDGSKGKGSDDSFASEPSRGKKSKAPGKKKSKAPGKKKSKAPKTPKACEETIDDDESSKGKGTKSPTYSKGKGKGKRKGTKAPKVVKNCDTEAPTEPSTSSTTVPSASPSVLSSAPSTSAPSVTTVPSASPSVLSSAPSTSAPSVTTVPSASPSILSSAPSTSAPSVTTVPSASPSVLSSAPSTSAPSVTTVPSASPSVLSSAPSTSATTFTPEGYCDPTKELEEPCYLVPGDQCPGVPDPSKCGSINPCDACPSESLCREGTANDIGEGNFYCVACGCGFYDSSGTACCKANGGKNNCIPNSPGRDQDQCSPDHFGGIPSVNGEGSGGSDICNGNEVLGGNSNLMAPVNSDCVCVPSAFELCKTPSNSDSNLVAKTVCRAKDMTDADPANDCDQCRTCMIAECNDDALDAEIVGIWDTELDVIDTLNAWNDFDLNCRTAMATVCAAQCVYDPNATTVPSASPSLGP